MSRQRSITDITALESILNYPFTKSSLLQEALFAPQLESPLRHTRLAVLGTALLELALLARWYETEDAALKVANARIEFMTSDRYLGGKATDAALAPYLIRGLAQRSRRLAESTMADTIRAILGAVFVDFGQKIGDVTPAMRALGIVAV